jgi:hypothetical protein
MPKLIKEGREEIKRALLLMKYDTKKTLTENQTTVKQINEDDAGFALATGVGGATVGAGAAALGAGTLAGGSVGTTAMAVGTALGATAGGGAALIIGSAALSAGIALAVLPLIYWGIRKDTGPAKQVQLFFQMCSTTPNIDKLPRKFSDSEIRDIADNIYDAINHSTWGFMAGTDEEKLFAAFKGVAMGTASDVCALYKRYTMSRGELYEDLDSDIDSPDEWEQIYRPIRNCWEDSLEALRKLNTCKEGEITDPKDTAKCIPLEKAKIDNGKIIPNPIDCSKSLKRGCKSSDVGKIQKCLNDFHGKNLAVDNAFGSRTESALGDVIKAKEINISDIDSQLCKSKGIEIPGIKFSDDKKEDF